MELLGLLLLPCLLGLLTTVASERPHLLQRASFLHLDGGTEVPKVPRAVPIPGSQTWPSDESSDRCTARNAYTCGDGQHCCCMFGCSYDLEKDNCTACDAADPLVRQFHIPSSHLWKERAEGICSAEFAHRCGAACCCNANFRWNMETRHCEAAEDLAMVIETLPAPPVPPEDVVPGSQTWTAAGISCESRNAYSCSDGQHCCCRFGCVFNPEKDSCSACSADSPQVKSFHIPSSHLWAERIKEGTCEPEHSHACGKACCCHGKYRWDLEQRHCVAAASTVATAEGASVAEKKLVAPPKPDPVPGSQTWLTGGTCEAKNAYKCGDHCCCMFGCEFNAERDSCTSCSDNDPLVAKFHIPASHLWNARREKQLCDEPQSHRCGQACCCNAGYLWNMESRRCIIYK